MSFKFLIGLFLYKMAPIKHNRYVFTSFNGHYSDNTKAISIKLHEVDKNAEIVWLISDEFQHTLPKYVKGININSLKSYWYRGSAVAQIDNIYGFRAYFQTNSGLISKLKIKFFKFMTQKRRQPIFATMHGTPLKKIGRDQVGNCVLDMYCSDTYLLVGDSFSANVLRRVTFEKIPIEITGWARNDILFFSGIEKKREMGIPEDKRVLLYAPTFRNDGKDVDGKNVYRSGLNQLSEMDFDCLFQTLSQKFGGDWIMICRFHYHVANMVDWNDLNKKYPNKFINGNLHDDMADYLACSDILITDSSSCMFDFCLTKRPCFIYFPDLEHYRDKERGFYIDIETLPFSVAIDFDSLIKNIDLHQQNDYTRSVDSFIDNIGARTQGDASKLAVDFILEKIDTKKRRN